MNGLDYSGYDKRPIRKFVKKEDKCFICKKQMFSFICIMKPRPQGGKMMNFENVCKKHYRHWMKGKYRRIRRKAEKVWKA